MRRLTNHHCFAWTAPSHYLNQCWDSVDWSLRNKLQWHFTGNRDIFIQEKMRMKMSIVKRRIFCLGLSVLRVLLKHNDTAENGNSSTTVSALNMWSIFKDNVLSLRFSVRHDYRPVYVGYVFHYAKRQCYDSKRSSEWRPYYQHGHHIHQHMNSLRM